MRFRRRPDSSERHLLSLYDGRTLLGHILEQDGHCSAITWPDELRLGEFANRKAAAAAIGAFHAERDRSASPLREVAE